MGTANTNNSTTIKRDQNIWAMLCHISVFSVFFIPFGNIISPLAIWLIKKDELPFVNDQGKEVVNFQITLTIYVIASAILSILIVGIPFLIGFLIFGFVATIIAAVKANEGQAYRYPLTIRFID
ncbi:MAG: DUF4870 domain-containing protein [Candidatus Zhuqueibacterota bacterium]